VRAVTARGRWLWAVSGLATAAVLAVPGAHLVTRPGEDNQSIPPNPTVTRSFPVSAAITSLTVQSQNDGPVTVRAGAGRGVQVTEQISYPKPAGAPAPRVQDTVSHGRLTLADPACAITGCSVTFQVTVPATVFATVSSGGAPVSVTGVAGANIESGGSPVTAARISGPLTVSTGGGALQLTGLTGPLHADTGGAPMAAGGINGPSVISTDGGGLTVRGLTGQVQADTGGGPADLTGIRAGAVTVITGGGGGRVVFAAAPESVNLFTDGGPAVLEVPGGPYALTASNDGGGPESVRIATDPAAARTLEVSSGGGALTVAPAAAG
jgi:hypothetical protein